MLPQEIENHVTTLADIGWIHGHLAKIVFDVGTDDRQGTQAVPQIVECEKTFGTHA